MALKNAMKTEITGSRDTIVGMKLKKKYTIIIAIVVVIGGGFAALKLSSSGDELVIVQAELAYRDSISELVTASGRIQPQTKVNITSQVSGEIMALFVKEGDRVSPGQSLLLLDTVQLRSDVAQASYSLDETKARSDAALSQLKKNSLEKKRQAKLFEKKLTSERAHTDAIFADENSRANYEALKAQVKTMRARLEKAQDNLSKTLITAPMEGVITYLSAEVGEIAQAQTSFTQGKTLMTIADLSVFEVEVDVDETEVAKVALGQMTKISVDAFRDTTFEGIVVEIGNSAKISGQGTDNFSTDFLVKIRFADTDAEIRPGMSATVDITTSRQDDAVLIPYASIVTREFDPDSLYAKKKKRETDTGASLVSSVQAAESKDVLADDASKRQGKRKKKIKKSGVFVVRNGVAEFVEVATGIADERNIVALTGVSAQDTIISGSYQTLRKLKVGEAVTIEESSIEKMNEDTGDDR